MITRKPKFAGKKTKWEKRRVARRYTRTAKGKNPLVEPLAIAPVQERQAALKEGKMVFYDGNKKLELELALRERQIYNLEVNHLATLQGVYKLQTGEIITLRATRGVNRGPVADKGPRKGQRPPEFLFISILKETPSGLREIKTEDSAVMTSDLAHVRINEYIQGQGIGIKLVSKTERNQRARNRGQQKFELNERTKMFLPLFRKLGYSIVQENETLTVIKKKAKYQKRDNMRNFHRIEAIDPKTGKTRFFTFLIQKTSVN